MDAYNVDLGQRTKRIRKAGTQLVILQLRERARRTMLDAIHRLPLSVPSATLRSCTSADA